MAKSQEFDPRVYTDKLREKYSLFHDKSGRFWIYKPKSGLWQDNAKEILEMVLRRDHLPGPENNVRSYYVNEIQKDLTGLIFSDSDFPESPDHLIPFMNGCYDLKTDKFFEYNPDMYFISKLAVNYNDQAKCPLIDNIFAELQPPERVIDLYELAAYTMIRVYPIQKWFILYGSGANGKSVYANIIEKMIGAHNVSHVSLNEFQTNRFAGSDLRGKFINICGETDRRAIEQTDLLKKLTGGDTIRAEEKFQDAFAFRNYAKLIFICNELPRTSDKSYAFYRRSFIITFPFSFEGDKADKTLMSKIDDKELEGLAFKCLGILREIRDRGFIFTNDGNVEEIREEYERLSNPFDTFFEELFEEDYEGFMPKQDLKAIFTMWLKDNNHNSQTDDKAIKKNLKERGFAEGKRTLDEGRVNCWQGFRLKERAPQEEGNGMNK